MIDIDLILRKFELVKQLCQQNIHACQLIQLQCHLMKDCFKLNQ
jgi:hypothetical protein